MKISSLDTSIPKASFGQHIGIFGGSFDPPHVCHTLMAISMLALEPIDELWIIPCANHPFSKKLSAFSHRLKMCELAFSSFSSQIKIVPIEGHLPGPSYTVQTLKTIKEYRANIKLSLALGSDLLQQIPRWHEPALLSKLCNLVVFLRARSPIKELPQNVKIAKIYGDYVLPDIRSTHIREKLKTLDLSSKLDENLLIDRQVLEYIAEHKLYSN